jgi:hypothetical protein
MIRMSDNVSIAAALVNFPGTTTWTSSGSDAVAAGARDWGSAAADQVIERLLGS